MQARAEIYAGAEFALLTRHGKQRVIAPAREDALGCRVHHVDGYDTDLLGTFTRDIPRFGTLRVIASMQPYHAIDDGRFVEKRLGRKRCLTSYAFRSFLDAGAHMGFGSDWPVAPLDPILGIDAAVNRQTLDGKNADGWFPEQKITVKEAIRAYTLENAYAAFMEGKTGSISAGKYADIIILNQDILTIPPKQIKETKIDLTMLGGKVVYERAAP